MAMRPPVFKESPRPFVVLAAIAAMGIGSLCMGKRPGSRLRQSLRLRLRASGPLSCPRLRSFRP